MRGVERQHRERTRGRAVLMCAREIDTRETVCRECVGIGGTLFFLQRTDRTYLKAKLCSKFTTRARREEGMETGDTDTVEQRLDILIMWFCVPIKSTGKDTIKMY